MSTAALVEIYYMDVMGPWCKMRLQRLLLTIDRGSAPGSPNSLIDGYSSDPVGRWPR